MIATENYDVNIGRVEQSNMNLDNALVFNNTGYFFYLDQSTMNISSSILKHNSNSLREFITFVESNVFITDTVFEDNEGDILIALHVQTKVVVSSSHFLLNRITYTLFSFGIDYSISSKVMKYFLRYIVINDSVFSNNQGKNVDYRFPSRGMVAQVYRGSAEFTNCSFSNNAVSHTAGILFVTEAEVALFNCTVTNNTAHNQAGAIYLHHSSLLVKNSVFINNLCGIEGGTISAYRNSTLEIFHSIFKNNKALGADGGAIFLEDESSLESDSCHFLGNTATLGGGAVTVVDHSSYTDTGSTFANNSAADNGRFTIAFRKSVLYFELLMIIYHFKFKSLILFGWSHSCS